MDDLVIRNKSRAKLRTIVKNGNAIKICRGLYLRQEPTPEELLQVLQSRTPEIVATGISAGQIEHDKPLTFPVHLSYPHVLASSTYFMNHKSALRPYELHGQAQVHFAVLAAAFIEDDTLGLKLLDAAYAGVRGKARLEEHMESIPRLPRRSRKLLDLAALGTDSGAEKIVVRGLRERGLQTESNVFIGPYLWDIVLPDLGLAVEIDGFEYHSKKPETIRDAWKTNDAVLRGWRPLRYTGSCVTHHCAEIIEQIATALSPDLSSIVHTPVRQWHRWFSTRSDPWDMPDGYRASA